MSKLRIIFMITSVILLLSVIAGPIYAQESGTGLSIQGSLSISGGKLEGCIVAANTTDGEKTADISLAVYEDNTLLAIRAERISIPADGARHTYTISMDTPAAKSGTVKLMVWEDLFCARPLCGTVQSSLASLHAGLTWAPPALVNPTVITLTKDSWSPKLDNEKDYLIQLPDEPREQTVRIQGGRNVVLIGGHIRIPKKGSSDHRAIYILDGAPSRTVHIEGVLVTCHDEDEGDAIAIDAPNTIVQVENFRVENLQGAINTKEGHNHSDIIQPWGGVAELRVDKLTGSSNYQGLFLNADFNRNGAIRLKNINLTADEEWFSGAKGGYMLWLDEKSSPPPRIELENVYVKPRMGRSLESTVHPANTASIQNGYASWPGLAHVTGGVYLADASTPDFVPAGSVGIGYTHKWGEWYK